MIRFKQFIVEYLTVDQRNKFKKYDMTDKARSDTDHFFGKDNDQIHGELSGHNHVHDKSEIHKAVEHHLGKEIPHEDYHKGTIKDKYGRDAKIGRSIKDETLRNQYASDTAREGSKKGSNFKTSTVRGVEVAGQTNSKPTKEHPKGHSWGNLSCKNVDDGKNKKYLKHEIQHGTVVHRVHDHTGQEIYRGTLQPHHNKHGDTVYHLNSEYGIKHPAFTKSAHEVASKLSGEYKPGTFKIHPKVYNDGNGTHQLHPNTTAEHISKALNVKSRYIRRAAIRHPKATAEHISKALDDKDSDVRLTAIRHPKATAEHISKALDHKDVSVRYLAIQHPKATAEHISKALDDETKQVRLNALKHPKATAEHISKALKDKDEDVRRIAKEPRQNNI